MSLLKRILGIQRAKRPQEDVQIDFDVKDLKKGYILDYELESWEVEDVAIYTWDNGVKDYEYTITNGSKKEFLNYETVDARLSIYQKGKMGQIWSQARAQLKVGADLAEASFSYDGRTYYFYGEGAARVKSLKESWDMVNWLFISDDEEHLVSFNKYSDGSMDAYLGKYLPDHAISNILPRK